MKTTKNITSFTIKTRDFTNKIVLSFIFVISLFFCLNPFFRKLNLLSTATTVNMNLSGGGTDISPYLIQNTTDWNNFIEIVNSKIDVYQRASYKLTSDLDFNNVEMGVVGNKDSYFMGTFDGGLHPIKNINVTCTQGNCGLFGYIKGATIKNVRLYSGNVQLIAGNSSGSLVGACLSNKCTITNCGNYGVDIKDDNIYATDTNACAGGLVGYCNTDIEITNSFNTKSIMNGVKNTAYAGGIIARINSSTAQVEIRRCFNEGDIISGTSFYKAKTSYAGGILGYCNSTNKNNIIEDCFSTGSITAYAKPDEQNIKRVYNDELPFEEEYLEVSMTNTPAYAGGICGFWKENSTAKNCYSVGTISGGSCYLWIGGDLEFFNEYAGVYFCPSGNIIYLARYSNGIQNGGKIDNCVSTKILETLGNSRFSYTIMSGKCISLKDGSGLEWYKNIEYYGAYETGSLHISVGVGDNKEINLLSVVGKMANNDRKSVQDENGGPFYYLSDYYKTVIDEDGNYNGNDIYTVSLKVKIEFTKTSFKMYEYADYLYSNASGRKNRTYVICDANFSETAEWTSISSDNLRQMNMGTNWAIDNYINNGYPHLKNFYWQDSD